MKFKVVPEYDDKYCACKIVMPQELESKRFDSIVEAMGFSGHFLTHDVRVLNVDPPVFYEYYARPYADALKKREHKCSLAGKDLSFGAAVKSFYWDEIHDFFTLNCEILGKFDTTIVFKVIEVEE